MWQHISQPDILIFGLVHFQSDILILSEPGNRKTIAWAQPIFLGQFQLLLSVRIERDVRRGPDCNPR